MSLVTPESGATARRSSGLVAAPARGSSRANAARWPSSAGKYQQVYSPTRNQELAIPSDPSDGTSSPPLTWPGNEIRGHLPSTPYRISLVRTPDQLDAVVAVRREAYGSRLQALADQVGRPEDFDFNHEAVILLLEDRINGKPLATTRLNTGKSLLPIMADMELPGFIADNQIGYVSRMAIVGEAMKKPEIRILMDKAVFQLCWAKQIRNMLIFAVVPRQRIFMSRGFKDIFEDRLPRHPAFLNRVPIRALAMDVVTLERHWREMNHPMYEFIFNTFHPEIEVFSSVTSIRRRTRRDEADQPLHPLDARPVKGTPTIAAVTE